LTPRVAGRFALSLALAATAFACTGYRVEMPSSLSAASRSYREHRDVESLQVLMGSLRVGMPEDAVKAVLGEPDTCPTEGQCYYGSEKRDRLGRPYTLVVEYRYTFYANDEITTVVTHRLEEYSLSPVGE
jgi:hypothetical protein